jgi:hypothetical protein
MHSLSTARYQVVLCGAEFAGVADFMLLKQHRAFQPAVPFLIVADGQDRDLVKSTLEREGVEDIVVWPLLKDQLEESLQHAMCLYQTRLTMAHRQQRPHALYSCQSLPPKHTRAAIRQIEANLKDLARLVDDCEREAQERTIEHLDLLGRGEREASTPSVVNSGFDFRMPSHPPSRAVLKPPLAEQDEFRLEVKRFIYGLEKPPFCVREYAQVRSGKYQAALSCSLLYQPSGKRPTQMGTPYASFVSS